LSDSPLAVRRGTFSRLRLEAFGVKGYRYLWSANICWNLGRWMEQVAVGWIAFELTRSPLLVALIGFYRSLPLFLLGIFGGVLGDRYDRQRVMLSLQVVNVVTVAAAATLSLLGQLNYTDLAVAEVVLGVSMAFDWPSRRSLTVDLVGRDRLTNAVAMDATGQNVSRTIGPLVSGLVIAAFSPGVALAILAGLYLTNAVLISRVPNPASQIVTKGRDVWHHLTDGVGQVLKDQAVIGVLAITVAMNLFFFPYQQLLPVVAVDVLGSGSVGLGGLSAADGLGSLIGTLLIALFASHRRNGLFFWIGSVVSGVALIGFSTMRVFALAALLLFVGGFFRASFSAFQAAIVLRNSSDRMRGRAMGILTLAIGVGPFGTLEIGALAQAIGTPLAIFADAAACVLLVAAIGARLRRLREA